MTIRDILRACADGIGGALFICLAVWAFIGAADRIAEFMR